MTPVLTRSNEATLRETFRQLIEEAIPESKDRMADLIIDRNREAFEGWARERLLRLIGRLWPKPPEPYQGFLFTESELHRALPLPKGEKVKYLDATITQLRLSIAASVRAAKQASLARIDPDLERRQQLINEMAPYSYKYGSPDHPLTVRGYRELLAKGVPPPAGPNKRSDAGKRRWTGKAKPRRKVAR